MLQAEAWRATTDEKDPIRSYVGSGGTINPAMAGIMQPGGSGSIMALVSDPVWYPPVVVIGTGGASTGEQCHRIHTTGGLVCSLRSLSTIADSEPAIASPAEQLLMLRRVLNLSITDVARILRVERPTIYEWLAGGSPRPNNLRRINDVSSLAQYWGNLSAPPPRHFLNAAVLGYRSLLDVLSAEPINVGMARAAIGRLCNFIREGQRKSVTEITRAHGFAAPSDETRASRRRRVIRIASHERE